MRSKYAKHCQSEGKLLFAILMISTIVIIHTTKGYLVQLQLRVNMLKTDTHRVKHSKSPAAANIICVQFVAGLGNNIFQFASVFGISRYKGYPLIISKSSRIAKIFRINNTSNNIDRYCKGLPVKKERKELFATFDPDMVIVNMTSDMRVGSYLQSWKYFVGSKNQLRQQLIFQDHIKARVHAIKESILQNKPSPVTLIGVHVRRGDMVNNKLGFQVATPEYIHKAVRLFQQHYENILFIVSSNDIAWCKYNMPGNASFIYIHNTPEIDMAVLAECDHTIMTVGTFGWWCAWLAGGNVTYYKHPAVKGSWWDRKLSMTDHFPANWVGL